MPPSTASPSTDDRARSGRRILAALVVLIAVPLLLVHVPRVVAGVRARRWPTVQGTIRDQYFTDDRVGKRASGDAARLHVQYDYAFGADAYSGSRITPTATWVRSTESARSAYAVGSAVTVHVNPDDPQTAALDVGLPWAAIALTIAALVGIGWATKAAFGRPVGAAAFDDSDAAAEAS